MWNTDQTTFRARCLLQINTILNQVIYEPFNFTSTDTLMIDVKRESFCELFFNYSHILTMGTPDRNCVS